MNSLERLVPSFDTCMKLTKQGIIITGSVLCWVMDNDDQQVKLIEASRMMDVLDLKGEVCFLSHAPTAGELMKWIRAKHPDAEITSRCVWPGAAWIVRYRNDDFVNAHDDTDIAALAALVLEVSND